MALTSAYEKSTYIITVAFYDEDGTALTPVSGNWSLTNGVGAIVNSRDQVTISGIAASQDIVLGEADLTIVGSADKTRVFTVEAVYNSVDHGNSLPLKSSARFKVINLDAIT